MKNKQKIIKKIIISITAIILILSVNIYAYNQYDITTDHISLFRVYGKTTLDGQDTWYNVAIDKTSDTEFETHDSLIYTFQGQLLSFANPTSSAWQLKQISLDIYVYVDHNFGLNETLSLTPRLAISVLDEQAHTYTKYVNVNYERLANDIMHYYVNETFDETYISYSFLMYMNITTLSTYLKYEFREFCINNSAYIATNEINNAGNEIESALNEQSELEESILANESDVENAIDEQSEAIETYLDRIENPIQYDDYPFFLDGLWENQYISIWLTIVCFFMLSSLIIFGRF